ncbi:hypothetical protein IF1G_09961 [Cordyceps javanica]|uniref:Uncharacterized protein n=1 Tax=Cordyceps javanica TaxID=43265 RepID=A0A545UPQ9_9HYPO|nr:hypothetical protein IF1G_09961 [Cordyceps javanica]
MSSLRMKRRDGETCLLSEETGAAEKSHTIPHTIKASDSSLRLIRNLFDSTRSCLVPRTLRLVLRGLTQTTIKTTRIIFPWPLARKIIEAGEKSILYPQCPVILGSNSAVSFKEPYDRTKSTCCTTRSTNMHAVPAPTYITIVCFLFLFFFFSSSSFSTGGRKVATLSK